MKIQKGILEIHTNLEVSVDGMFDGLYFHNTVDHAIVLTNMVEENLEGFTRQ